MEKSLDSFFNAKSIAIIGASEKEGEIGNLILKKLDKLKGKVIPIHKKEKKIEKIKCYKKLDEYSKNIDLAIIIETPKNTPKYIEQCGKKEIKNIILYNEGKSKKEKIKLSKKISRLQKKYKLNILGTNSSGIINPKKNLDLTLSNKNFKKGQTVFISQSSSLGNYILDMDIELRAFISLGNMEGLTFSDWIEFFNQDKKTKKIVCYMGNLTKGNKFMEVCKDSEKEIIVIKPKNIESETKDEIYQGAFRQLGIKRSRSLVRAFGIKEDNIIYKLKGEKIKIISNSKGASELLKDRLKKEGYKKLEITNLQESSDEKAFRRELKRIDKNYDSIIVLATPNLLVTSEKIALELVNSKYKNKIVACFLGKKSVEETIPILERNQISYTTKAI